MLESRTFCSFSSLSKENKKWKRKWKRVFFVGSAGWLGDSIHLTVVGQVFTKTLKNVKTFGAHLFDKVDQDDLTNNTIGPLWTVTQHG